MGAEGITIHSPENMQTLDIETLCSRQGTTVLEYTSTRKKSRPMSLRIQGLRREGKRRRTVTG